VQINNLRVGDLELSAQDVKGLVQNRNSGSVAAAAP
jgi:hypothetical protein